MMNALFPESVAADIEAAILSMLRCYSTPSCIIRRLNTVKLCNQLLNTIQIARQAVTSPSFVAKWRDSAKKIFSNWPIVPLNQE